jgi:hypothetical protein
MCNHLAKVCLFIAKAVLAVSALLVVGYFIFFLTRILT